MSFFISDAYAQAGPAGGSSIFSLALPFILLAVFYFLMIRPQQKRVKEHKAMVDALKKGDEIVTSGGLGGTITKVGDGFVQVQIANNVEVSVQQNMVASLLPKGTLKKA
jgi:preprotein translocase subunit YajC